MPKQKPNKSAMKRAKRTNKKGNECKIMISKSHRNHLKSSKTARANRSNRKSKQLVLAKGTMKKAFKKLLPNS